MHRRVKSALVAFALLALMVPAVSSQAKPKPTDTSAGFSGIRDVSSLRNRALPLAPGQRAAARRLAAAPKPVGSAKIGDNRTWLAIDDLQGSLYLKKYKLRALGDHVQVWTATGKSDVCDGDPETPCPVAEDTQTTGLNFLPNDCRNGIRTKITSTQAKYFVRQFEKKMYPKESQTFGRPPKRNGGGAALPGLVGLPKNYYKGTKAQANDIVVLIDNVRDDQFYDFNNQTNSTYIAGFFFSTFNELLNKNVMNIDGYDWIHRTGANPPNEPDPTDLCKSAPGRPYLYEGTFAHEYQHLLEYYDGPGEASWVDEGLADWAQTLTGYVDPRVPIDNIDFDGHIQCFLGNLGIQTPANPNPRAGGPENSLTNWSDQGDDEILCDYGAAYTFTTMLADRYGNAFMKDLHNEDEVGIPGLQKVLDRKAPGTTVEDLFHQWLAMVALDRVLDEGATLSGGDKANYTSANLDAAINWDVEDAFSTPGAPPNGADFVRLRDGSGNFLSAANIDSISFNGGPTLPPDPVEWTVESNPPDHTGDAALYSGSGDNFDRSIVTSVKVPSGNSPQDPPTLTFDTNYSTEELFDYGVVQVSTDGGSTYTSLSNADTTSEHDAIPAVIESNLPGLNGNSGCEPGTQATGACDPTWVQESFDLTPYAGQDILLAFRYLTDGGVSFPGWYLDNVAVGNKTLSDGSDLTGWQTISQVKPVAVSGFTVQLVGYTDDHTQAFVGSIPLDGNFDGTLSGAALDAIIGTTAQTVAALVTYDEGTELQQKYAPYVLTVDGTTQPGGA